MWGLEIENSVDCKAAVFILMDENEGWSHQHYLVNESVYLFTLT